MRARFIALSVLLVVAFAASADDHFTVFMNDLHGGGISLDHAWNARWSTEASIGWERRNAIAGAFVPVNGGPDVAPVTERRRVDTHPMDLTMRFHFPNDTRWTPYIAAGAHYAAAPGFTYFTNGNGIFPGPLQIARYHDRLGAEIGGGTTFRITPHVGLQLDFKQQLRNDNVFFDPVARGSFGVNWKW